MEKSPEAFRTISEVSEYLETPPHVLRFWESRFPQVRPVKRAGGRRYYRPSDVALLGGIKLLLHDQGMTIRGVQKILREQGIRHVAGLGSAAQAGFEAAEDDTIAGTIAGPEPADAQPLPHPDEAAPSDRSEAPDDAPAPSLEGEMAGPEAAPAARADTDAADEAGPAAAGHVVDADAGATAHAAEEPAAADAAQPEAPPQARPVPLPPARDDQVAAPAPPAPEPAPPEPSAPEPAAAAPADAPDPGGDVLPMAVRLRRLPPAALLRHGESLAPLRARLADLRRRAGAAGRGRQG